MISEGNNWICIANSCIIEPNGIFLPDHFMRKEHLVTGINLSEIVAARRVFDVADHYSRPGVYRSGVDKI